MHLLRVESHSIDDLSLATDLGQSAADIVVLSFTDTDLSSLASAWESDNGTLPSLRLARLSALRHPYSVDLYVEKVLRHARFILVRLLGGIDYWRYGVDQLAALARSANLSLAVVPGDGRIDRRLDEVSTLPIPALRQISGYFSGGGVDNINACLRFLASFFMHQEKIPRPRYTPAFGLFNEAAPDGLNTIPTALIIFYKSALFAGDIKPVLELTRKLATVGFRVSSAYITSLKDGEAANSLQAYLRNERPDIILNLTAFAARLEHAGSVLDEANVPVLQLTLSGGSFKAWAASQRGLGGADLAMSVVLPEFDGRIIAGAISFREEIQYNKALEFTRSSNIPSEPGIEYTADLALSWTKLARTPRADRRLALIISDYPAKEGRTGYAVGLDTPASLIAIASRLDAEGYRVGSTGCAGALARLLSQTDLTPTLSVSDYRRLLTSLAPEFTDQVCTTWGEPHEDASVVAEKYHFAIMKTGNLIIAVQPDRGHAASRKDEYHDTALPPRHSYMAFYLWLRKVEGVHAIVHCGTHGTLEWLPGKATALSEVCAPRAVLGPVPLIYPFIVNNPGEAAQAKRRSAAVTVGHLMPALEDAGTHGEMAELEGLFDEYAEAQALDPRRAVRLAELIMEHAANTGVAEESGVTSHEDPASALPKLDAWLCDVKGMQIGIGLHVFGSVIGRQTAIADSLAQKVEVPDTAALERLVVSSAEAEMNALIMALDGRFVSPGPAASPYRGRLDVLPTGRNLYGLDPRAVPTKTAWELGSRTADALVIRHAQDHGEWLKRLVLDVWGSSTMRTGGDDLAQAYALLGVCLRWDNGSARVSGFDVLPLAVLKRPRVDVTLRISGLFRDVFPEQIALFNRAVSAVAALDEMPEDNPLSADARSQSDSTIKRVFGAAPGTYGVGLSRRLAESAWSDRGELGEAYLNATAYAYMNAENGVPAGSEFRRQVAMADAFMHVQDMPGQDIFDSDAFAEHEGGFAAAASVLGNHPAIYHGDTVETDQIRVRTMREEVALVLRARATNPRWLDGQMQHGYRGAAEIAQTIDNFFAYAALTDVVTDRQFSALFDAILGDESVRHFLTTVNPAAAYAVVARFKEAIRRGLWITHRNLPNDVLADMKTENQ
jgi:cobaltochelatase CobN